MHCIRHRSCWTTGDYCYLQDLFVDADSRRQGVGAALIGHAADYARNNGCERLHWLTHETNATAMKLYDQVAVRSGFVQFNRALDP